MGWPRGLHFIVGFNACWLDFSSRDFFKAPTPKNGGTNFGSLGFTQRRGVAIYFVNLQSVHAPFARSSRR